MDDLSHIEQRIATGSRVIADHLHELGRAPPPGPVEDHTTQMAGTAMVTMQERIDELRPRPRDVWACQSGCCTCCFQAVPVTAPEAVIIGRIAAQELESEGSLLHRLGAETFRARLAANATAAKACQDARQYAQRKRSCAFLVGGRCAIYDFRPFACRAMNSTSAMMCDRNFADGTTAVPTDLRTTVIGNMVLEGLLVALREQGLDDNSYELHGAVERVMGQDGAGCRFANGEPLFAGATHALPPAKMSASPRPSPDQAG